MKTAIDRMVNKFLAWKLPEDFGPDCGISFTQYSEYEHPEFGRHKFEPIGTNLFHEGQAKAMLEHVCAEVIEENAKLREELEAVKREHNIDCRLLNEAIDYQQKRAEAAEQQLSDQDTRYAGMEEALGQISAELAVVTKERDEALDRIKASQEQEPVAWCVPDFVDIMNRRSMTTVVPKACDLHKVPLYTAPIISPTEAELQSQLAAANSRIAVLDAANVQQAKEMAELTRKLAEQQAIVKFLADAFGRQEVYGINWEQDAIGFEELTKLLAEERKKAAPEGWKLVPVEPTDAMKNAGGKVIGITQPHLYSASVAYKAMLSAAPQPDKLYKPVI